MLSLSELALSELALSELAISELALSEVALSELALSELAEFIYVCIVKHNWFIAFYFSEFSLYILISNKTYNYMLKFKCELNMYNVDCTYNL